MNDKDKEAFNSWWKENMVDPNWLTTDHASDVFNSWQAACDYKQKEIDELKDGSYWQSDIERLEAENAKLKECVEFYARTSSWNCYGSIIPEDQWFVEKWFETIGGKRARRVLKELDEE